MISTFAVYQSSGRIFSVLTAPTIHADEVVARTLAGTDHAALALPETAPKPSPETDYVDLTGAAPALRPRPTLEGFDKTEVSADGADAAVMAIPDPCAVTIDGAVHEITGGVLEIAAAYPGAYTVEIDHFPYRPFKETVTCA